MPAKGTNNETIIYELLSPFFRSVKNLFVFDHDGTANDDAGIRNNRKFSFQEQILETITW